MKTELLALAQSNLATATANQTTATQILALVQTLPDDVPPVPGELTVIRTYGGVNSPLAVELTWPALGIGQPLLDVQGAPGNPNGPQEWTPVPVNAVAGPRGEWTTYIILQHAPQTIVFRLRALDPATGAVSEPRMLPFTTPADPVNQG